MTNKQRYKQLSRKLAKYTETNDAINSFCGNINYLCRIFSGDTVSSAIWPLNAWEKATLHRLLHLFCPTFGEMGYQFGNLGELYYTDFPWWGSIMDGGTKTEARTLAFWLIVAMVEDAAQ